ncbi:Afadin and alpha-actinin-binding-domain-containing protein [Podospora australis]|uniref:Afadin and alpha-actinin-binding-domain-containing protein n=1 Tax=Podospora australis TaxID=1536484 RepID=A0AAN6WZA5_9PEZI|nr:Afadin and alpha-actinin-binding-domain-containing protein [Podospora australis]
MIESENLRTASLYINNQLLSRGLLRDGQSIDFARPGDTDGEVAETMSRIMGVVNDLILRRDRDAEHRESLSATLRTLRAESLRQANDIQRLQEKHAEAQRKAGLSEASEATLRTHLKVAEGTVQRLKEEASRTKLLAAQTRSACATEVRKRDRQIEGLKKAVTEAARARGASKSPGVTTITVVGDIGEQGLVPVSPSMDGDNSSNNYDLRQETNSFLAELAKGLSEENEGLLSLIRRTTESLKDMSGWNAVNGYSTEHGEEHALPIPAGCAEMTLEVDAVLEHLRTILTNPSFVPIEEVVVREDEINRLRDGWEKMETRWKEAVHLIDGWRRRMQASGRPVNVEELKMGLRLSPVKVSEVEETAHGGLGLQLEAVFEDSEDIDFLRAPCDEGPLDLVPEQTNADDLEHQEESDASSVFDDNVDADDYDDEEPNVEILQQSVMSNPPLPPAPQLSPLRDHFSAGNKGGERGATGPNLRRRPKFEENLRNNRAASDEAPIPPPHGTKPQSPQKKPLLSLRTVPPEEAAEVALPKSAAVSTPDTSVSNDSVSMAKSVEVPAPKPTSTTATRPVKRPSPMTKPPTTTTTTGTRKPPSKPPSRAEERTERKAPSRADDRAEKKAPSRAEDRTERKAPSRAENSTEKKVTTRPPVKRPAKPPITRGRSETRKAGEGTSTKPPTRNTSATSTTSTRSAPVATSATVKNKETALPADTEVPTPSKSPRRVNSRLPLPRGGSGGSGNMLPPPQQSPLSMATIQAKLVASERDADAARVRAKLKAARLGKGINLPPPSYGGDSTAPPTPSELESEGDSYHLQQQQRYRDYTHRQAEEEEEEEADELGMDLSAPAPPQVIHSQRPRDRKRGMSSSTKRVESRRRSTLNSMELETLIQGGNVTVDR